MPAIGAISVCFARHIGLPVAKNNRDGHCAQTMRNWYAASIKGRGIAALRRLRRCGSAPGAVPVSQPTKHGGLSLYALFPPAPLVLRSRFGSLPIFWVNTSAKAVWGPGMRHGAQVHASSLNIPRCSWDSRLNCGAHQSKRNNCRSWSGRSHRLTAHGGVASQAGANEGLTKRRLFGSAAIARRSSSSRVSRRASRFAFWLSGRCAFGIAITPS
jgi:hypothetical protein